MKDNFTTVKLTFFVIGHMRRPALPGVAPKTWGKKLLSFRNKVK